MDFLEDIWDSITEAFTYVISFEWFGDIWESATGIFDNMGEFSIAGTVFGLLSAGLIFMLRKYMLDPFLLHMGTAEALFWGGATYLGCGLMGYMVGKKMFDD